jgi:hypothetical protein
MNRLLLQFLLFIFILSCFGCSITKRRYTGGYYVSWHHKTPDAGITAQAKTTPVLSNKKVQSKSSSAKTEVEVQTEKTTLQRMEKAISSSQKVRRITKNNSIVKSVISTYTVTPENTVPEHDKDQRGVARSSPPLFGVLSILSGLISWTVSGESYLAGSSMTTALLFVILTSFLLFLTIYKAVKILHEVKQNPESGGKGWAIFGIILAIFGLILLAISIMYFVV